MLSLNNRSERPDHSYEGQLCGRRFGVFKLNKWAEHKFARKAATLYQKLVSCENIQSGMGGCFKQIRVSPKYSWTWRPNRKKLIRVHICKLTEHQIWLNFRADALMWSGNLLLIAKSSIIAMILILKSDKMFCCLVNYPALLPMPSPLPPRFTCALRAPITRVERALASRARLRAPFDQSCVSSY